MALRILLRGCTQQMPVLRAAVAQRSLSFVLLRSCQSFGGSFSLQRTVHKQNFSRTFAVSAISGQADRALSEVLKEELDYEEENNSTTLDDIPPPDDWVLKEKPGETVVTLSRKHKGEDITLEFSVDDQSDGSDLLEPELDENGENEPKVDLSVDFTASIAKGGKALTFDLSSDGNYLEIHHVGLVKAGEPVNEDEYDGPVYNDLDDKVQEQFQEYLEERNIRADLGEYLLALADRKEQIEYVKWLGNVKKFVDQK